MPNSKQHQAKAQQNQEFLDSIDVARFASWTTVAAFYTAVHLVERLRAKRGRGTDDHSTDHHDRLEFVRRKENRQIQPAYEVLFNASLLARYETIESFNQAFTTEDIRDVLIAQYLKQIEDYVATVFATP